MSAPLGKAFTRAQARAAWAASGLTYDDLTIDRLEALRDRINVELKASRPIRGFCARSKAKLNPRPNGQTWADIRCSAYYFTHRQAVTFEPGGFIGFAGWASDENVTPILRAFIAWVADIHAIFQPTREDA